MVSAHRMDGAEKLHETLQYKALVAGHAAVCNHRKDSDGQGSMPCHETVAGEAGQDVVVSCLTQEPRDWRIAFGDLVCWQSPVTSA